MTILINGTLSFAATILLLGVIGEKNDAKRRDITYCFLAIVATIIAINIRG